MAYEYYFDIKIDSDLESISNFILNELYINQKNKVNLTVSPSKKDVLSFINDIVSVTITNEDKYSKLFKLEDYGVEVSKSFIFRYYSNSTINQKLYIIEFIISLLKKYAGDCILQPNGDYAALLRRNGELFIDTSKGFFNEFDLSIFDLPYTDTKID